VDGVFTSFASSSSAEARKAISLAPKSAAVIAAGDSVPMEVGARWVAEEIPVGPAESALVLEREMQNAFAAFAAAGLAGSYEPGPVNRNNELASASIAPPAIGVPTPFAESTSTGSGLEPDAEPAVALRAEESASTAGAESSSSEISRPPVPPFAPIVADEANVAFGEPRPLGTAKTVQEAAPKSERPVESRLEGAPSVGRLRETAASQDGWRDLHQRASNSPNSGGTGDDRCFEDCNSGAETANTRELENNLDSAAMAAAAPGDSSASSSSSDASLSSIVDSMLAELKPKLLAELAKKLEKK
jgi:hypothetical protein